ncbi:drug/metabolite transporter (DMT)-like permease [Catalinimonas alkaloidigena]|uniref:DMT family transporter n=1 Tax=Catalinimonas alkaloidigena TaxID=1075417 RepID=UPI0024064261|nr:DMT family transporter [Catalinimonas alkaloidigena]MDF9800369.1 drug/metabolite transporter (DMT)-like permease [Catalinimonas alkaloidigena]
MIFSRGVWYMIVSVFFFSCMGLMVKLVPHIPSTQVVFFRSIISLVLSFLMLKRQNVSVWGNNRKYLLLRGMSGAVALILFYETLQHIPLASAVTIGFLAPIFTTLLGVFIIREGVYPLQWLFFLAAFGGVVMVQGFDNRITPFYFIIGIIATFFSGLAQNFIRKLNTNEHPLVIIFYFPLITTPITGIYSLFHWESPQAWDWAILIAIGLFTQFAQFFMTKSIQLEELSKVSIIRYLGIIYALAFGYIFFDETYNIYAYGGMAVAVLGVILNLWYKQNKLKKSVIAERLAKAKQ